MHEGEPWSLRTYLGLALLLRLPAVLWADGFDFPDQQFQYVEPAWHLATGGAWHEPWEYRDGMRSWVYPGLLAWVFRGLLALGFEEPMATMRAVRAVHAVFSLLPLAVFWLAVVRWRPIAAPRLPLLLFAASGLMVVGVQPSGPSLAATLAVTAGIAVAGRGPFPGLAGLCLGFAFAGRFQDAVFGPAFFGVLLWQRRWSAACWFGLGCVPGIVTQGLSDLAVHGEFLGSLWRYFASNLGTNDAANAWHGQPLLFYVYAGCVPVLAFLPMLLGTACARLRAGSAMLPAALVGGLLHIAAHSVITRKALRFEYPALALLLAVLAAGLPAVAGRAARWDAALLFVVRLVWWTLASFWFGSAGAVRMANWRRELAMVAAGLSAATVRAARWHTALLFVVHLGWWALASFWFGSAGAVRMANWLREQPQWNGAVYVVDGDATMLGGCFYSRPPREAAIKLPAAKLAAANDGAVPFLIVVREPLSEAQLAVIPGFELAASFHGMFDLRRGDRRYVYRRR